MGYFGNNVQRSALLGGSSLRDFTHASKIFRPGSYDLAPKFKFLFHTFFDINPIAYNKNVNTGDNFGVLVKTVKLPSFTINTHTLNQYNRKRIVQTRINYDNVNITFHDDNSNMITKLWDAYYTYYYKDGSNLNNVVFRGANGSNPASNQPGTGATNTDYNRRNIYDESLVGNNAWGFIGESTAPGSLNKVPFFRNITVFGFNRHKFTSYSLINPMITKFDHDTHSYSDGAGIMECRMDFAYETVVYNEGAMDGRTPDNVVQGFGLSQFYDTNSSPITPPNTRGLVPGPANYVDAAGGFVNSLKGNSPPNINIYP